MIEEFLTQLYRNFLGREPDAPGLSYWDFSLQNGSHTAASVTREFLNSVEHQTAYKPIVQLYLAAFDRVPDADGLEYWVNQYRSGASLIDIANAFVESDEFKNLHGQSADEQFIKDLYRSALSREPDGSGEMFWNSMLDFGIPRSVVMLSFATSPEMTRNRSAEVDYILLHRGVFGEMPTREMIDAVLPVSNWEALIEKLYEGQEYGGVDVPGLDRYEPPEPQPEPKPEPEPDPGPPSDAIPPSILAFTVSSATTLSVTSSESGSAGLYNVSDNSLIPSAASIPSANIPTPLNVYAQGSVTSALLRVSDSFGNTTTSSTNVLLGTDSSETLTGTSGVDYIFGFDDNDAITGGAGADELIGGEGNNQFVYEALADLFATTTTAALTDSITGGAGTDQIVLGGSNLAWNITATNSWNTRVSGIEHIIVGGANANPISIVLNNDAYEAGLRAVDLSADTYSSGNNVISVAAETTADHGFVLTGSSGIDSITGGAGNDTITGGGGEDIINAGSGNNRIDNAGNTGGPYEIIIHDSAESSVVIYVTGSNGVVINASEPGASAIAPTDRQSTITASASAAAVSLSAIGLTGFGAILTGGSHNDTITGGDGTDFLTGNAGVDTITGGGGNDTITGGAGGDVLTGGGGSNTYLFNTGDVAIGETVTLTGTIDTFSVVTTTDFSNMSSGTTIADLDSIHIAEAQSAKFLSSQLTGLTIAVDGEAGGGAETLVVNASDNTGVQINLGAAQLTSAVSSITGGNGNDSITGTSAEDTITGGAGGDSLNGGLGTDTFNVDAGTDTITDLGIGGADNVLVSAGATANATVIAGSGYIATAASSNAGTLNVAVGGAVAPSSTVSFENLTGPNGVSVTGGLGNILIGSAQVDTISGGGAGFANDYMYGGGSADTFNITSGAGYIWDLGVGGQDALVVSAGATANAAVTVNWTATTLTSNAGSTTLTLANDIDADLDLATGGTGYTITATGNAAASTIVGSDYADTIIGGLGADTMAGGAGADVLTGGARTDTFVFNVGDSTLAGAIGQDTITDFGTDADVIRIVDNSGALTGINLATDAAVIAGVLTITQAGSTSTVINVGLGFVINQTNVQLDVTLANGANRTAVGGNLSDTITGGDGDDTISGGDGADTITGGGGNDSLIGNQGDDLIYGNDGDDLVNAGQGNDTIWGGEGDDVLQGGSEGDDVIHGEGGDDRIAGGAGADTINGGDDDDTITGGAGADVLTAGVGSDTFVYNAVVGVSSDSNSTISDTITDLVLATDFIQLNLTDVNNFEVLEDVAVGPGSYEANTGSGVGGDVVIATSVVGMNDVNARAITILNAVGTSGNDIISGGQNSDTISGGNGNDTIRGGAGADEINLVGTGKDTVVLTTFATADTVTDFTTGVDITADVMAFDLSDLNTEMGLGHRLNKGNGSAVLDSDFINFSIVISNGAVAGVTGITFDATDNIYLVDEATAVDVKEAIEASSFAPPGQNVYDGDGILVAFIDPNSNLVIAIAALTVTGVSIDTATLSTISTLPGTFTLASLATGNFDFIA